MAVLSGHSYQTTLFWIHKYSHCCSCCSDTSNKVFSELSVITPWAVSSSLWAVRSCLSQHFTPLLHASNQNTAIQNSCTRLNQAVSLSFLFYLYSTTFQRILVMIESNESKDCYVFCILLVLRGDLSDGPLGPQKGGDKNAEVDLPYRVCRVSRPWLHTYSAVLYSGHALSVLAWVKLATPM